MAQPLALVTLLSRAAHGGVLGPSKTPLGHGKASPHELGASWVPSIRKEIEKEEVS